MKHGSIHPVYSDVVRKAVNLILPFFFFLGFSNIVLTRGGALRIFVDVLIVPLGCLISIKGLQPVADAD